MNLDRLDSPKRNKKIIEMLLPEINLELNSFKLQIKNDSALEERYLSLRKDNLWIKNIYLSETPERARKKIIHTLKSLKQQFPNFLGERAWT